jgi:hypothetical protein
MSDTFFEIDKFYNKLKKNRFRIKKAYKKQKLLESNFKQMIINNKVLNDAIDIFKLSSSFISLEKQCSYYKHMFEHYKQKYNNLKSCNIQLNVEDIIVISDDESSCKNENTIEKLTNELCQNKVNIKQEKNNNFFKSNQVNDSYLGLKEEQEEEEEEQEEEEEEEEEEEQEKEEQDEEEDEDEEEEEEEDEDYYKISLEEDEPENKEQNNITSKFDKNKIEMCQSSSNDADDEFSDETQDDKHIKLEQKFNNIVENKDEYKIDYNDNDNDNDSDTPPTFPIRPARPPINNLIFNKNKINTNEKYKIKQEQPQLELEKISDENSDDEEEEVFLTNLQGKDYYVINEKVGPIYEVLKNNDVGNKIGILVAGKPQFFNK